MSNKIDNLMEEVMDICGSIDGKEVKKDNHHKKTKLHNGDRNYPRLQFNKRGLIILALGKPDQLTRGVLVGYKSDCEESIKNHYANRIGQFFSDWEVSGELEDLPNGEEITCELTFFNQIY